MVVWVDADRLGFTRPERHDGSGRMLRPYRIQLATPFQASIESEPLPLVEVFGILSTRWHMLSNLQSSSTVLYFLSESTRAAGYTIHEEA